MSPACAQAILCQGDSILDVKLLDLRDAYMVKVGDLEPLSPSVCAPKAYQKWMILDPRAKASGAPKKRKRGPREDDDDDDEDNDRQGPGSAGRKIGPHDAVPLTFWSPSQGLYRELIHRFNAGCVFDLTAVDNVSAIASVPYGLAWTAIAQTAAHAAHLRARVAAGLFNAMLDCASPLFSAELASACRGIAPEISGIVPEVETEKTTTPVKRPRLLPGYTASHLAASATRRRRRDQSRLGAAAREAKAGRACDEIHVFLITPGQAWRCRKRWGLNAVARRAGDPFRIRIVCISRVCSMYE